MTADTEKETPVSNGTIQKSSKGDVVDLLGGDGPWQRRVFLVIMLCVIPNAAHNLSMSFLAPNLDHWCARPDGSNLTVEEWKSIGLPEDDRRCSRYKEVNFTFPIGENLSSVRRSADIVPCDAWEYDETLYTNTVLSQWDLVCEREWLVSMSKSVFMVGILVSVLVFGQLADRMGRRLTTAAAAFVATSSAIICAFSTSFIMFIVARFFIAVGISGVFSTGFVLLMEIVGPEFRSIYGIAVEFGWCIGFVCLPGIAWLIRDWFWIQMALTAPCLLYLGIWWMIPESPRWLMSQGRVEDAQKVLSRAAAENSIKLSDIDTTMKKMMARATEVHESGETHGNVFDLLRTPGLWQMTLNVYFMWFVNAFVYYGLSYNTNELAGDPFVNFLLSGVVEFPAYVMTIFAIRYLGRRNPLAWYMIIGGVACLLMYPLPEDPWWLTTTVSMVGKFCITCSFAIIFVFTAEIFPTVVRNIGMGSASMFARFGSILAPFVRELGHATHPVVPQIIFGFLAVASGAMIFLLPETNNCSIPDTLKEAAQASRNKCKKVESQNGHHVVVTLSNTETEASQPEENTSVDSPTPPSPKPQENGKKLADVPEEDSHCDDIEEASPAEMPEEETTPASEEITPQPQSISNPEEVSIQIVSSESTDTNDRASENDDKTNL